MKEVILISDEYHEIENFIKKYSHKKINLLILEPQNLKTLNTILNYPEINFIHLLDKLNEDVIKITIKETNTIDQILEDTFGSCCHQWGTLCEGGFLSQEILNLNILILSIKNFCISSNIESIFIGKNFLLNNYRDRVKMKNIFESSFKNIKINLIKPIPKFNFLIFRKIYFIEILRTLLFFYNTVISYFYKRKKLQNSYEYIHILRSTTFKHTHKKRKIIKNLNFYSIKTLILTFDINIFDAKELFKDFTQTISLESQINLKIVAKIFRDYTFFLIQLYINNSFLKRKIKSKMASKYNWIVSSLRIYSISELIKRLFFFHIFKSLKKNFQIINPYGPPESAYYEIVKRILNKDTIFVYNWHSYTNAKHPWPYSDKNASPDFFFVKDKDEFIKIEKEYDSKILLCEEIKELQIQKNISHINEFKESLKVAYDINGVIMGSYTRADQFTDLSNFFEGISLIEKPRISISLKAHPSSGDDRKNYQIYKIFKNKYKFLNINFIPKNESGEKWVLNNDLLISRVSSLQEFAHLNGKTNICIFCTGEFENYLKPFCNLATNKFDIYKIFNALLKNAPIPKTNKAFSRKLNISTLNTEKYSSYIVNLLDK